MPDRRNRFQVDIDIDLARSDEFLIRFFAAGVERSKQHWPAA